MLTVGTATIIPAVSLCLVLAACGVGPTASARSWNGSALAIGSARPQFRTVELAALALSWSSSWTVIGAKSEPTYVENVRISRRGDQFALDADAFGEQFGRTEMSVDGRGRIAVLACPHGASCDANPTGFLATVQILAAARRGQDLGRAAVLTYAGREVACAPAEVLGAKTATTDQHGRPAMDLHAVVDPCFDTSTGAVLAQRSRNNDSFTGPTLDEATLVVLDCGTGIAQRSSGSCPQLGPR
jgi:hypothetical protein